jgi:hypothetical protein
VTEELIGKNVAIAGRVWSSMRLGAADMVIASSSTAASSGLSGPLLLIEEDSRVAAVRQRPRRASPGRFTYEHEE